MHAPRFFTKKAVGLAIDISIDKGVELPAVCGFNSESWTSEQAGIGQKLCRRALNNQWNWMYRSKTKNTSRSPLPMDDAKP